MRVCPAMPVLPIVGTSKSGILAPIDPRRSAGMMTAPVGLAGSFGAVARTSGRDHDRGANRPWLHLILFAERCAAP
jgi:hypothetical protein